MKKKIRSDQGFTLLIAVVVTATLLLVSTGIISLAVKESFLTSAAKDSQHAFYAADTGIECALYWDTKNPTGASAFTDGSTIKCNQDGSNLVNPNRTSQNTFEMTFQPQPYCADVTVTKSDNLTTIESRGYNTCDTANPRRVERGVKVSY